MNPGKNEIWRKTEQFILPAEKPPVETGYDIYPSYPAGDGSIYAGFEPLAEIIAENENVIIDGYQGVFFGEFGNRIMELLARQGKTCRLIMTSDFLKTPSEIESLVIPFLGGDDPLFGKYTSLSLSDFYNIQQLECLTPDPSYDINIIIGPGAALSGWDGLLLYLDLPKNEIQFRSRAANINNLGARAPGDPKKMYKRFFFIDWIVLNKHKKSLLPEIDIIIDCQRPDEPTWMRGDHFRKSLSEMCHTVFRVRPWFEPGTWGGNWIKEHITGLSQNVPNYAWSFELIVPENGIILESSGKLMEVSFDFLMYHDAASVLGDCHERFGTDFPIRFDFLDTFGGGNLSVQCHPVKEYMEKEFGGSFTQEETYYILDSGENASVYLGFRDDIDRVEFQKALEESYLKSTAIEIERYVERLPARKHDLFLIPPGTIHGSGKNNLVLEISSTPYIFTFKMYDWLRPDLDGKPRPLNIRRGMDNLFFDRKGKYVSERLISKPVLIDKGYDWEWWHLPTHETHLYDVHRYRFSKAVEIETGNKCHVLSLVEGQSITVVTASGFSCNFSYAETFVVPAGSLRYKVINNSDSIAVLVKAFVK